MMGKLSLRNRWKGGTNRKLVNMLLRAFTLNLYRLLKLVSFGTTLHGYGRLTLYLLGPLHRLRLVIIRRIRTRKNRKKLKLNGKLSNSRRRLQKIGRLKLNRKIRIMNRYPR